MCGTDIPIEECKLVAHQPTIKEISYIGEEPFYVGAQTLCVSKKMISNQGNSALQDVSDFQIFMTIISEKEASDKKNCCIDLLQLMFPDYKTLFTPRSIVFAKREQTAMVDENNFASFQNVTRTIFCLGDNSGNKEAFNPANDKAREIAEKMMRGRQRVAESKGEVNASILSQYISSLAVGLQMPLEYLINLTIFQLYDLVERYQLYTNWDIDIRSRLAGAKPDDKPDNWMKNLH